MDYDIVMVARRAGRIAGDPFLAYPLLHATVTKAPKSSAGGVQQEQEMGKRRTIALASITCGALACVPLAWAAPAAADDKLGLIGLLVTVCIVIRLLPDGFSGWFMRRRA
jgi:hypothetical protein